MLKKEDNFMWRAGFWGVGIILIILLIVFRVRVTDTIFPNQNENLVLSINEREELENLRVENETLKNNLKDLKEEINLIEDGLEPTYVKMLGVSAGAGDFYGSFYVTYPKDKTVYKGMNIYTSSNVLVGTVEEVLKNSLFITRLGQNKSFLAESDEVKERLELSSLSNGLYVGSVAGGTKISVGDQVVLKGYPKAVVGSVSEIQKNEGTLSTVFVRAPYNIYQKQIFYVLQ